MGALLLAGGGLFLHGRYQYDLPSVESKSALFENNDQYIEHVTGITIPGLTISEEVIERGDNFWRIGRKYDIDIDTLIGVNPFWDDLLARVDQRVAASDKKGVLQFVYNLDDIPGLAMEYGVSLDDVMVQKLPRYYRYWYRFQNSVEPVAVFLSGARPRESDMMPRLAAEFSLREMFRSPLGGRLTSHFGVRVHPIARVRRFHDGIDIAARHRTPVTAAKEGVVVYTGWKGGYGIVVVIDHDNGYRTLYGHLSSVTVKRGARVEQGKMVGRVGSTGYSTGPHLHFTLWKDGKLINPMKVLW